MGAEGVGLKIQVVGGSCRVSVLFQLTFVRGFSTTLTLNEWRAKKMGALIQELVHEEVGLLTFRFW